MASEKPNTIVPSNKKLRSQPPDVIVAVGQGENKTEFECYKFILCYNCEYFDAMFSLPMRENETSRIELPDKDPGEWKEFYEFIDPATASMAELVVDNVMILVPWFHEYQMDALLAKCDDIIHDDIIKDNIDVTSRKLETLLENTEFCEKYSLKRSLEKAIDVLSTFVMNARPRMFKGNLELLKRVFDIYKSHGESLNELICNQTKNLFAEIEIEENESEGEDIWENKYFQRMIETKLENMFLKKQYKYSDLDFGAIKGSVVIKGAGLDVVNGVYIRQSHKCDSVSVFSKYGLYKGALCRCVLSRRSREKRWHIKVFPEDMGLDPFEVYSCIPKDIVNDLPHGYDWQVESYKSGMEPPPIVEYNNQPSGLSGDNS